MLLGRNWNRSLALILLTGALFCILVPGCDGLEVASPSPQTSSVSSTQSSDGPLTPSEAECWCCCAHVIAASFHVSVGLSPLMQADTTAEIQYLTIELPTPTQPPR